MLDDRHRLAYLNPIERLNCLYCGYANGVIASGKAASPMEQYGCPIKHARRARTPHDRYHRFLEHGDAEAYAARPRNPRRETREAPPAPAPPQPPG